MISFIVLILVIFLIITRQVGNIKLQIWQAMTFGALLVLLLGEISLKEAVYAVDWEVILFLFSMFVIGVSLERSGYLTHLTYKLFKNVKNYDQLLIYILFVMGFLAAFLTNDTIAIIATPVMLLLAEKYKIDVKILLITLAFSITIGSVLSPIGNPQNFVIANNLNVRNQFFVFFKYLFVPTVINIFVAYFVIKKFFKKVTIEKDSLGKNRRVKNKKLTTLSKISLTIMFLLLIFKILSDVLKIKFDLKLVYITLISSLPILIFSNQRIKILKRVDWQTLIFFISMFILTSSVWKGGTFQKLLFSLKVNLASLPAIMIVSVVLSQFISNVPLVVLYIPVLKNLSATYKEFMCLATSSTIAGNLTILGAASNIIIIQLAERKLKVHNLISFFEFFKIGVVVTFLNMLVYYLYFLFVS